MTKEHKKALLILTGIYTASQILLCLISGIWWDDWFIFTHNADEIIEHCNYFGYPWEAINFLTLTLLPAGTYRIVVFIVYLITGLVFYEIMRNIDVFSYNDAFWIAAIAMTAPINDSRVFIVCYGYGLSLCLFMTAFYLIVKKQNRTGVSKTIMMIVSLLLLALSYLRTESLLVFTGLIWLYLLYISIKNSPKSTTLSKLKSFIGSVWIYVLLPFLVFFIKSTFIGSNIGAKADYKAVTISGLLKGIIKSPTAMIKTGLQIGYSYFSRLGVVSIIVFALISAIYIIYNYKAKKAEIIDRKHSIIMLLFGCVTYYAGGFAYIVFHEGRMDIVRNVSVGGRDAILLGFGIAIMTYYFLKLLPLPLYIRNLVPIMMIILGTFHFAEWYLNYQEDWFQQLEFARILEDENYLPGSDTILVDYSYPSECDGRCSLGFNSMYLIATDASDKFFIDNSTSWVSSSQIEFNKAERNCLDYETGDMTIDGVILLNNSPLPNNQVVKLRFDEVFNKDSFNREIKDLTNGQYIPVSKETSDTLYEMYESSKLSSKVLRELLK